MQINIEESNEAIVARYQAESDEAAKVDILGILYQKNHGLIYKVANRYSKYEDINDLTQEAYFGIRTAADLYDQEGGANFASYAFLWLRQTIKRYIDTCGSIIRCPGYKSNAIIKLNKIINKYMMEFDREPTDKELCGLLDITDDQLNRLKNDKYRLRIKSLDALLPENDEDDSITLGDMVADDHDDIGDLIDIDYNDRLKLILWDEVAALTPREEDVIVKHYRDNMSLREIGSNMGLTAEGARKIEACGMRKLRKSKRILQYRDDYISTHAFYGGLRSFQNTQTSSTERTVIRLCDMTMDDISIIEKEIEEIDKLLNECKGI